MDLLNAKVKYYDGPVRALDPTFGKDYFDGSRNTGFVVIAIFRDGGMQPLTH